MQKVTITSATTAQLVCPFEDKTTCDYANFFRANTPLQIHNPYAVELVIGSVISVELVWQVKIITDGEWQTWPHKPNKYVLANTECRQAWQIPAKEEKPTLDEMVNHTMDRMPSLDGLNVTTPPIAVDESKEGDNRLTAAETERLAILIEECAEVQQIACKILRHGYESRNPTVAQSPNNRKLLETEVGDLLFAIEWLQQMKDIDATKVRYAAIDKKKKVQKYLHHNNL